MVAQEPSCSGTVFARLAALGVCLLLALSAADASGQSALSIATTTLPSGQVGTAYSATLAASGGTTPYSWSLTSGTLPAGLTLNAATGAITGTPTATANGISLTFKVTDSSSPRKTKSATLTLTIVAPSGPIAAVQRDIFTSLTCAPVCPTETIASTGAGNLLFVSALNAGNGSAPANIANISCTPSCGTWIYPGAACRAWSAQSAGEDCAYVLSSSAGATSITVTMSATSNQSQSLSFREYHSTAGGFGLSGGPSASLLSACTSCLTPNISVTGNNVLIAGGTPDHGFTGMAAPFGGVQFDGYGAIVGDNLNTTSGTGATLTENASGVASVFTIGFMSPAGALTIAHLISSERAGGDSVQCDAGGKWRHDALQLVVDLGHASCGALTEHCNGRHQWDTDGHGQRHLAHLYGHRFQQPHPEQIGHTEPDDLCFGAACAVDRDDHPSERAGGDSVQRNAGGKWRHNALQLVVDLGHASRRSDSECGDRCDHRDTDGHGQRHLAHL